MDFDISQPLRIQNQRIPDECTACAISAIAEDVLKVQVDENFIYQNSKIIGDFGVTPQQAIDSVIKNGVKTADSLTFPFVDVRKVCTFFNPFNKMCRLMRRNKVALFCGCYWQTEWENAKDGIAFLPPQWNKVSPHAFKIYGLVTKNGVQYLKVQNSRSVNSGDAGIWYFPKEVVGKMSFIYQFILN